MSKHIHCNEPLPDERIADFIQQHHVMTVATCSGGGTPWCAACFYAYIPEKNWFVFTSDEDTRHGREMLENPGISANIALETTITGKIRGVQLTGRVRRTDSTSHRMATRRFLGKFPIAVLKKTTLWIFEPSHIKMTDNQLGFGVKLIWDSPLVGQE
jgi:uncharacterized protein YhbP (UPF0306 family)